MLTPSLLLKTNVSAANSKHQQIQNKKWIFYGICLVFLIFFGTFSGLFSPQQSMANPDPQDFLKQFLPLSEDTPREIQNPYHSKTEWKLWAVDSSPVVIAKPHFKGQFKLISEKYHEVIPTFESTPGAPMVLQDNGALFASFFDRGAAAGFFDDVYMSLDNGHTGLGGPLKNLFSACRENVNGW